jgi:hypothetical protein
MDDLDVHPRGAGEIYRLRDGLDDFVGLVADMGEIGGLVAVEHRAERKHLRGCGKASGRREKAR